MVFYIPIIFSNWHFDCSNVFDCLETSRNKLKRMFWPFTVRIKCSIYLQNFANSWPSASHFQKFCMITGTIFSHNSSEQVSIQNTVTFKCQYEMFSHDCRYFLCFWTCFGMKNSNAASKKLCPNDCYRHLKIEPKSILYQRL